MTANAQLQLIRTQNPIRISGPKRSRAELRIETLKQEQQIRRAKTRKPIKPPRFLTQQQMKLLIDTAKKEKTAHSNRNTTMIIMAYHYGLRVSELCNMTWDQIRLDTDTISIERLKEGRHMTQILTGDELRRLKKLRRENKQSEYVFLSREGAPVHRRHFHRIVSELAKKAGIETKVSPHTLRHSCGFKLADDGRPTRDIQAYLGHSQINNTVKYTELSPKRLKGIWKE